MSRHYNNPQTGTVVKMGRTFEVLATNTLQDQVFIATPAIVGGGSYLRGENTLFCIR